MTISLVLPVFDVHRSRLFAGSHWITSVGSAEGHNIKGRLDK